MRRKVEAIVVAVLLVTVSIIVLLYIRSETDLLPGSYDFERYSYSVSIASNSSADYVLLVPYPNLMPEQITDAGDNATHRMTNDIHGRCLNVSGRGNTTFSAHYEAKVPLGSFIRFWTMNLTMTDLPSSNHSTGVRNYTGRLWSSGDNISVRLSFESGHGRYKGGSNRGYGEGYHDLVAGELKEGWQDVKIERSWWVT